MIITGCTERKIREESYNIPYRLRDSAQQYTADFVTDEMTFGSVRRTKYSGNSRHRTFANTDIEIEMQKMYGISVDGYSYARRKNYFIGVKSWPDYSKTAFYMMWTNRSTSMDTSRRITVDGKQKRVVKYFVDVPWDIGEFTDSLQTNLDIKEIKKLYPKFSGFYQKVQPDSIVVRYDSTFYSPFIPGNPMIYINGVKDRIFFK